MKKSLAHSVWECKNHIVWVRKIRRMVIFGKLKSEIATTIRCLCEYKGIEIIEWKACVDHIHMCVSIPPKYSVSSIVSYIKGKSAMIVFEKYCRLKKNCKGHNFWTRGYYVSTVGLDEARIRNYIKNQEHRELIEDQ